MNETQYGAHYKTAIKIFKNYPYFGVGLKNFRNESPKDIYKDNTPANNSRSATHPHQLHLEFLSETGIFGYIIFLIFIICSLVLSIKNYLTNKNKYQLASILFVIVSILPLIPSGSFFTSYGATIFWINYAIMISYQKK
jgi:O-antigen ligase